MQKYEVLPIELPSCVAIKYLISKFSLFEESLCKSQFEYNTCLYCYTVIVKQCLKIMPTDRPKSKRLILGHRKKISCIARR
jgi:hypothetical protein